MRTLFLSAFLLLYNIITAQITVTPALTAQQLVNVLTGGAGGSVTNISYTGHADACGSFTTGATPSNLGISSGIILSSGNATGAIGANTSGSTTGTNLGKAGNSLLNSLISGTTYDAAVLQFDFVPTTNTISFRYVFGSEEYNEYVNSTYNDVFAFFLTGPNPAGGTYNNSNIALVPGLTIPVAINNVNNGYSAAGTNPTGPCKNCQYFVNNLNGTSIKYDAFTTPLTATVNVTPCATYTIKLAIADVADGIYDSGVFIEQGSFTGINQPGNITNSTPLCGGVPVNFDYVGTGTQQTWTFTGGSPATANGTGPHSVTYASPGIYNVGLVVNAGCNMNVSSSVTISNTAPTSGSNSPICAGQTLNLTSSGGTTYSWSGPNGFTSTQQNPTIPNASTAASGTYNVTVTSAGGCVATSSTNVSVSNAIIPVASSNSPICAGQNINLSSSGGATYNWTGPNGFTSNQQNPTINGATTLASGSYTVTITSAAGCSDTKTINVIVNANPTISISSNSPICGGSTLNLTSSGGTTYNWTGPNGFTSIQQNPTITNAQVLGSGTYNLTVTDNNNCLSLSTTNVIVNSNPSITGTTTNVSCFGGNNGAINITVNGGTSPFVYNWSNGSTNQSLSGITSGTYNLSLSDVNSCSGTFSATITQPATALSSTISSTNVKCFGENTGSITINATGGTSPYSYIWTNGATSQNLTTAIAGEYSVTITDANLCTTTSSATVTQPLAALSSTYTKTDVLCYGNNTGAIDVYSIGGTIPYSYNWSNGASSEDVSNITAGNYSVTITDANLCTSMQNITITQPSAALTASNSKIDVACYGNSTGSINLTVNGGTVPYSFNWTNGALTEDISLLSIGNYAVTITDANGCKQYSNATISQPSDIILSLTSNNINCYGGSNGNINLNVSGGVSPYTYTWTNGATSQNLNNITAGYYKVTVTDANLCKDTISETLTQPSAPLNVIASKVNVLCYGGNTGSVSITVTGGTAPYNYQWSNGSNSQNINNVIAGNYTVTVTDSKLCTAIANSTVTQPSAPLSIILSPNDTICYGQNSTISSQVSGGTPGYSYYWKDNLGNTIGSNPNITLNPLSTSTYSIVVTDNNGCTTAPTYNTINVSAKIFATFSITNAKCKSSCDGIATVNITGGVQPFTYSWTSTTNILNNVCAGNYMLTMTDAWGCRKDTFYSVSEPTALTIVSNTTPTTCKGQANGKAFVTVSGGTSPFTFSWSNGMSVTDTLVSFAGTYSVTATDANLCAITTTVTITEPTEVVIYPTNDKSICKGQSTTINASANGGTPPYTFHWWSQSSNPQIGNDILVSPATTTSYFVYAKDSKGCFSQNKTITVYVYPNISVDISLTKEQICAGESVNLNAIISGGNGGPYYCTLNNSEVITFPHLLKPTVSDTIIKYIVTASDMCTIINGLDSVNLTVMPLPKVNITATPRFGCEPLTVQFNEITPDAGQSYSWNFNDIDQNSANTKNPVHTFNNPGLYDINLTVTSINGCKKTLTLDDYINVYANPRAFFQPDPITASIIDPVIYFDNLSSSTFISLWDFNDGSNSFETNPYHRFNSVGKYDVMLTVEDEKGCKDSSALQVIIVDEYTFYAPTAFTPGTDGINDIFFVTGNGIDENYFNLYIYDRWGEIVFYTDKYNHINPKEFGWDGKIKGKNIAEIGTYTWYALYKTTNGVEFQKSGPVSIIR